MSDLVEIVKALTQVQASLPKIDKGQTAKVPTKSGGEYSYKYADLSDVSDAILPLLAANGLAWSACPTLDESGRFVLAYRLMHTSGENIAGAFPLSDAGTMQSIGSGITYARRYALCSVVGVVPDEDDDGRSASQPRPAQRRQAPRQAAAPVEPPADAAPLSPIKALWAYANGERGMTQSQIEAEFARWSHGVKLDPSVPDDQVQAFLIDLRSEAQAA
jgi:hypothetical protein